MIISKVFYFEIVDHIWLSLVYLGRWFCTYAWICALETFRISGYIHAVRGLKTSWLTIGMCPLECKRKQRLQGMVTLVTKRFINQNLKIYRLIDGQYHNQLTVIFRLLFFSFLPSRKSFKSHFRKTEFCRFCSSYSQILRIRLLNNNNNNNNTRKFWRLFFQSIRKFNKKLSVISFWKVVCDFYLALKRKLWSLI